MGYIKQLMQQLTGKEIPLISIVMPSYNQSQYIKSALNSILEQGIEEIEIIVVDGGSTDGTIRVLEQISASANGKLKWFSESDEGAANAINKGFLLTKAHIIGWLNSDDLYAKETFSNVINFFSINTESLMVYGQGQHIDESGNLLDIYPTMPPETDINNFKNGCFICQPSVFMRRNLLFETGLLNAGLQTAFDFDLWLRIFLKHQSRIGYIDEILAYSRLHRDCKTIGMRKTVALEAMQLLKGYLGSAPAHWLLTYFNEMLEHYPHIESPDNLPEEIDELSEQAREFMDEKEYLSFKNKLSGDSRYALLQPDAYVNIYADGWLPPQGFLRARATNAGLKKIVLDCSNTLPGLNILKILITTPWGDSFEKKTYRSGDFKIEINISGSYNVPAYWSFGITSNKFFVPHTRHSNNDFRKLTFRINKINIY